VLLIAVPSGWNHQVFGLNYQNLRRPATISIGDEVNKYVAWVSPVKIQSRPRRRAAQEFEPHGKAAEEIRRLYEWICGVVDMPSRKHDKKAA
jgi:hypothetical protein